MIVDRKIAPQIHDAIEFDYILPSINKEKLNNGLPFYWFNAGVQDVVQIDWVFPAGLWQEQKTAVAHTVAALLKNGTTKYNAEQINEALEFYGAQLKVAANNDYGTITLYSLTKHLPVLLPIVYEIITDAQFPEQEVELHKKNAIQKLLINLRQCEFVANRHIDALLFGEHHPYGRYTKKEDIEAITRQDLLQFYNAHFNIANMQIFMAGKMGSIEVKCMNDIFGNSSIYQQNFLQRNTFEISSSNEKAIRITNDINGVQGAVRIGRLFPDKQHPDFAPMVVLNTLFGGYFGSRLMSNIREDKGYTYGIYSSLVAEKNGGSLVVHTETGRDVAEKAIIEIYKEMELLCNEQAPDEELLLVKNYLLGGLLGDLDGPFSILRRWRSIILNGFTDEHFNNNINTYKTVSPEKLLQLAQKYFNKKDFFEVMVI